MQYFIVFNKKGIVQHESGSRPVYLNSLIKSINMKQLQGSSSIQDSLMEYEIRGQDIYLSIANKPCLKAAIEDYNKIDESPVEPKTPTAAKLDDLNFSESSSISASILDSIKKADFKRTFKLFTGKIKIDDLRSKMIEHLVMKNVDPSFCQIVTDDVISELRDEKTDQISEGVFKEKVKKSVGKILPNFDHDKFIDKIKAHTGTFSICFIGVNGVGKSTSLAKIACWLIQKGLKVYIAACDTFRAGAIEQLKVHVERFKTSGHPVGFFESGYAKDDSSVAKFAIMKANKENYDVVLIDTAGRMHNKENLMVSLTKLIKTNNPDHILFVGEALVGGDSLYHIKEFNKRIQDAGIGRKIDSIILTKVDTVDDKIGQVLNFTFTSNSPIMFLGTGQTNMDLKPLDADYIAEVLTS